MTQKKVTKEEALDLAKRAVQILDSKKAEDIRLIEIGDLTVLADYFVIANGTSTTQVRALADEIAFRIHEETGVSPLRTEGYDGSNWILIDYGYVVIHVFYRETREFYNLEKLWADGRQVDVSDLLKAE
ncbi:MAG: ribosome silencing factor [Clostridia bacterium]|nr:ribosome silencing factor [Clostridia bacterium]